VTSAPAALVMARAPRTGFTQALEPLLGRDGCVALQALLIRRAAMWAERVAPGAAYVCVTGDVDEVSALLPPGPHPFPAAGDTTGRRLEDAVAHVGRGPLLVAGADCPRLDSAHAAAALSDLAAGCDVVFGATLEGDWYLAALRDPRAELLTAGPAAARRTSGIGAVLQRAGELGAEVGLLRHERLLLSPADAAAFLADPATPADVRAALASGG
jgi:glycosyltransferase A (GT-A) superfamily protein (DUF2064 family)